MTTVRRLLLASGLVCALGGGAFGAARTVLPPGRILPGVRVEGHTLPDAVARGDDAALRAFLQGRIERAVAGDLEIVVGAEKRTVPVKSLVASAELDRVVTTLRWLGHERSYATRVKSALAAKGGHIDVPIDVVLDAAAIEKALLGLKSSVDDDPRDARLDLAAHTIVADHAGASLEIDGAVVAVSAALSLHLRNALRTDGPPPQPAPIALSLTPIHAKVTRDAQMDEMALAYPAFGFDRHKGYGTEEHRSAIAAHGLTPLHRRSFAPIQSILSPPAQLALFTIG